MWPASVRLEDGVFESRYRVLRSLGDGGMGEVVLAEHLSLGKRVAIKLMHPQYVGDEGTEQRFILETRAAARIHHDNVVGITDFGRTADGRMFFVMEYLEGEDLAKTLRREGPLPWRRAVHMVSHVVRGMGEAHRRGVIHRDIKPGNCFRVTVNGDADFIKVLDFGLAKFFRKHDAVRGPVTQAGVVLGTPGYMAPELESGVRPDPRVDLYSIGVLLVRLLTGKLPDEGGLRMLGELEGVPPALHKLVSKSLREDPDERFQTAEGMEEAIDYVVASTGAKRPVTGNKQHQASARGLSQPVAAAQSAVRSRQVSNERATQQLASGVLLDSMRSTPVHMPAVRSTTPTQLPLVRATPAHLQAIRGATAPLPVVGAGPSILKVVLIALGVGALVGGVMAAWMHLSQETGVPAPPLPQPTVLAAPSVAPVVAPVSVPVKEPAPVQVEAARAEPVAAAAAPAAAPVQAKAKKKRRARKSEQTSLGLKNPFEEKKK